jgi:hypothetical protein
LAILDLLVLLGLAPHEEFRGTLNKTLVPYNELLVTTPAAVEGQKSFVAIQPSVY